MFGFQSKAVSFDTLVMSNRSSIRPKAA